MEFRNLFKKLFKKENEQMLSRSYFQMLNGYTPVYTSYDGGLYEMMQTKAIINMIATDCGKAIPKLAKKNKAYEYILEHRPNDFMNSSEFIERVVTNYLCDNNSFIIPILDDFDKIVGLFPVSYQNVSMIEFQGKPYLEYSFGSGKKGCIELSKVGCMKRMQRNSDFFGDTNSALFPTLEIIHAQNESVGQALKSSGAIRFMGKLSEQLIDKESFDEQRKLFTDLNFTSGNMQMMIYDSRYEEVKQVESKPIYLDEKQQALIDDNLLTYFGVSSQALHHNFSDDYAWNSYYEGVIEPILIKLGQALTSMLFSKNQIMYGHCVYVTTNRLQYMSNQSKLEFSSQLFDRGIVSGNDVADVWQLPHYENGDKHFIRREYAEINKLDDNVEQEPVDDNPPKEQEGADENET